MSDCRLPAFDVGQDSYTLDVSLEALDCPSGFAPVSVMNLENPLSLSERLGRHVVSGRVDGVGSVVRMEPVY